MGGFTDTVLYGWVFCVGGCSMWVGSLTLFCVGGCSVWVGVLCGWVH